MHPFVLIEETKEDDVRNRSFSHRKNMDILPTKNSEDKRTKERMELPVACGGVAHLMLSIGIGKEA